MTQLQQSGLDVLRRTIGRNRADRVAFLYRDRLLPTIEAATYRADPRGRRSRQELRSSRDEFAGKRCVIIGNGPSLNRMDLSVLRYEYCFALNRGYLLFDRIGGPTTFLVAVNRYVVEQFGSDLPWGSSRTFVSWRSRRWVPDGSDVTFVRRGRPFTFSNNIADEGAWEGATVTYVALQLAYHFGFAEVILIGVDHSFSASGPANLLVTAASPDPNHFDPTYFGPGVKWQLPDLDMSEVSYRLARRAFEADGRTVWDATVNGNLTIFAKRGLDELIRG